MNAKNSWWTQFQNLIKTVFTPALAWFTPLPASCPSCEDSAQAVNNTSLSAWSFTPTWILSQPDTLSVAHRPVLIFKLLICGEISTKVTSVIYFLSQLEWFYVFSIYVQVWAFIWYVFFFFFFIFSNLFIVYKSFGGQWFGNNLIKLVLHHRWFKKHLSEVWNSSKGLSFFRMISLFPIWR